MIKKISLALVALFFATNVRAQSDGCFIRAQQLNAYGLQSLCASSIYKPICKGNSFSNYLAFGDALGQACDYTDALESDLITCNSNWNLVNNAFNQYVNAYNQCAAYASNLEQQVQVQFKNSLYNSDRTEEWKAYAQYLQGLEQRLRKKCGSKCKKVK